MRVGSPLDQAFEPGEQAPCRRLLEQVLKSRRPVRGYRAECHCGIRANQSTMLNASPLLDDQGRFAGAVLVVRDVTRLEELERRLDERAQYQHIIGKSKNLREIYDMLDQLKDLKTTVLITGESGTGKEMIVDALHYASATITGPLVKVNCSALAESLLESELFGHVRGAFTGAVENKVGRFQAAEGGTIFLDEIGDIAPSIQLKLLRILERKEYERVGDSNTRTADVRVVAATNMDLWEKVQKGLFRPDLYYRLRVMTIEVPPLRERREDIPLLTQHFVDHYAESFDKDLHGVTDEVLHNFMRYAWPGNVRELKHTIEHAGILCTGGLIATGHLPSELQHYARDQAIGTDGGEPSLTERDRYLAALERARWNKSRAAAGLGVSRTTLYRKLRELGIEP
jgi:transcriptional regulator with PAS, ATPase and Fis domain